MKVPAYVTVTHSRFKLHPFVTAAFPREAHPGSQRQHVGIGMQAVIPLNVGVTFFSRKGLFSHKRFCIPLRRQAGKFKAKESRAAGKRWRPRSVNLFEDL